MQQGLADWNTYGHLKMENYVKLINHPAVITETLCDLVGIPDPKHGESNHVLAPKDVPRAAAARHTRDLASEIK